MGLSTGLMWGFIGLFVFPRGFCKASIACCFCVFVLDTGVLGVWGSLGLGTRGIKGCLFLKGGGVVYGFAFLGVSGFNY